YFSMMLFRFLGAATVSAIGYLSSLGGVTPAVFKYLASSSGDVIDCQSSMLRMIPASSSSSVGYGSGTTSPPAFSNPDINPRNQSSDSCSAISPTSESVMVGFVGRGTQPKRAMSSSLNSSWLCDHG